MFNIKVAFEAVQGGKDRTSGVSMCRNSLWDYMRPQHFDLIVKCALQVTTLETDIEEELSCNIKIGRALRERESYDPSSVKTVFGSWGVFGYYFAFCN